MDVDQLFREHHVAIRRYLVNHCGDPELAADAVQETYLRLVERPPPRADNVRAWLFTVATNVMREGARKASRRRRLLHREAYRTPLADAAPSPDEHVESTELREAMHHLLQDLPARDRTMLLMREEGFSHREIAEAVGVRPSSVGTLMVRALEKIESAVHALREEWL